jgi:hypothetical protein
MKKRRYSDDDHHFWPFTLSFSRYRTIGIILDSGGNDGHSGSCHIRLHLRGVTLICELPRILRDHSVRHHAKTWDAETVARIGRDWYDEVFPREYGFTVSDGTLHVHYGPQPHDSTSTKRKCYFLPWRNWRHIRHSLYDLSGEHFHTEHDDAQNSWAANTAVRDACPKIRFEFDDFDGQRIVATTHIEEREWHFGTGVCRWLSWFRRPKISRDLMLEFSAEVGPEKGSWKGGTCGHAIEMLPGELHEAAFKRYCQQEHRSKYRRFRISYVGPVQSQPAAA